MCGESRMHGVEQGKRINTSYLLLSPLYKILYPKTSYEQIVGLQDYIEQIAGPMIATATPYASATDHGLVKIGNNLTVSSGTVSLTQNNVNNALGYTPVKSQKGLNNTQIAALAEANDEVVVATRARKDINGKVISSTYMPLPVAKTATLTAGTGWVAVANSSYSYQYKLAISGLTSHDIVNVVVLSGTSQRVATQAFLCSTNESFDGYIYLFAKNNPTANIQISYTVLKGAA